MKARPSLPLRICTFVQSLNWPVPNIQMAGGRSTLVWFESGAIDECMLQVSYSPTLCCVIYAIRYRIFVPWHALSDHGDAVTFTRSQGSYAMLFDYNNFNTQTGRRRFRLRYPEYSRMSWRRVQALGAPHQNLHL